jgi:hypothetical protein
MPGFLLGIDRELCTVWHGVGLRASCESTVFSLYLRTVCVKRTHQISWRNCLINRFGTLGRLRLVARKAPKRRFWPLWLDLPLAL